MLKGFGISGRECSVSLELLSVNEGRSGVNWFYGESEPKNFKVIYRPPLSPASRTTILEHSSGKRIIGAEHLSAAALMFPNCEFKLNAPQGELPLLDGSAKRWVDELRRGSEQQSASEGKAFPTLEIEYIIDRFGHKFNAKVKICSTADLEKILDARTFIFEEDLAGANLPENLMGCGVLIPRLQGGRCGSEGDFRFPNEPAYHKILDLLGDLAVYGNGLPKMKISIRNGGHRLHHEILKNYSTFFKLAASG